MPRRPTKKKLIEIFETQYLMSEVDAKSVIEAHAKALLPDDVSRYVHMYGICGGVSSTLDKCLCCLFVHGISIIDPRAVELRVLYFVEPMLGDVARRKNWYCSDSERKEIDDKKEKAKSKMLAVFGYVT